MKARKPQYRRPRLPTLTAIVERERADAEREGPTRELRRHGRATRDEGQTQDAHGDIGRPWRVQELLAEWEEAGHITRGEHAAGLEFQRIFRLAALDVLKAADPGRVLAHGAGVYDALSAQSEWARRQINAALDAVGGGKSAAGLALWYVLGLGVSMAQFGVREGWQDRPLNPAVVKGAIVGALAILERVFKLA